MTSAPANLLAARSLLLEHLNITSGAPSTDLEPNEVGIVGDPAHIGGGHCGSDRVMRKNGVITDYTVVESPRDRAGLTLDAAALDVGKFEWRSPLGVVHNLRTFSAWCVVQCRANTADSRDIREIIYTTDGRTVQRWDRLNKRSTGDSSHLWHTHFTYFRDAVKAGRDQRPLYRRYLTGIGLIKTTGEPDMNLTDTLQGNTGYAGRTVDNILTDLENLRNYLVSPIGAQGLVLEPMEGSPLHLLRLMYQQYPITQQTLTQLLSTDQTDEDSIVAGVLSGLGGPGISLETTATVLKSAFGDERAAELGLLLTA